MISLFYLFQLLAEMKATDTEEHLTSDSPVAQLIDHVWNEALGNLTSLLSVPVETIKLSDVDKAESVLLSIKEQLASGDSNDPEIENLSDELYKSIPHKKKTGVGMKIDSLSKVTRKKDLCQVCLL